jgi:alpha-mannosidase
LSTIVILPADADLPVDLRVKLDWHEKQKLLRIAFPLAGSRFEYEIAAGWVERADDGREVSGQRWVRAVRGDATVTVINDAKYSYAAKDGTLFITAVRSPVYAHHDPVKLQPGALYRYLDQGEQGFTIRIAVGPGMSRKNAMRLANELICPPVATPHVSRGGKAPHRGQWLNVDGASSSVIALKQAEGSDATIVRAIELDGKQDDLLVEGRRLAVKPRGIVTAKIAGISVTECDGLER